MNKDLKRMLFPAAVLSLLSVTVLGKDSKPESATIFPVYAENISVGNEDIVLQDELEDNNVKTALVNEKIAKFPEYEFTEVEKTAYAIKNTSINKTPYDESEEFKPAKKYDEFKLVGQNEFKYWQIELDGSNYYISKEDITTDKGKVDAMKEADRKAEAKRKEAEKQAALKAQRKSYHWNGSVLNRRKGVNYGPTGKETYYNLPMQGVINIMRRMGVNDEYWVRDDGVKMLGDYIMVAANLDVHPRGSLVETSLGTARVCDSCGAAKTNPHWLDIAVTW